ncbi:hypothetical protein [Portibacter marinus]|uniref:hypothetical protein n=1 Tax=Portibacter marinus TaxID=2898660 RepID=UPI001F46B7FE|nr:hypothetical protein [Portibacter marinus]
MKNLLIVLILASFGLTTNAQDETRHRKNRMHKAKSEIELSEVQKVKMEERKSAYEEVLSDQSMSREEKKAKIVQMRSNEESILTKEQQQKMKALKAERSAERMLNRQDRMESMEKLKVYRAEFDQKISAADQETLSDLRQKLKAHKNTDRTQMSEADKVKMKSDKKMMKSLSLKYEDEVLNFLKEKGIDESISEKKEQRERKMKKADQRGRKQGSQVGRKGRIKSKGHMVTRFLLMENK